MRLLIPLVLLPETVLSQAQSGWGNVGQKEEQGFSWTQPLWPELWMAWTPATFAFFVGILSSIACIGLLEIFIFRDGIERKGVFGLTTTLGDRLFISLLGSAFIFLAWLGVFGQPIWIPVIVAIAWMIFVFAKV